MKRRIDNGRRTEIRNRPTERIKTVSTKLKSGAKDSLTTVLPVSSFQAEGSQGTYFKLVQSGAIQPITNVVSQTTDAIDEARGKSRFYNNVRDTRNLVMGLAMEGFMEAHNQKVVKKLVSADPEGNDLSINSLLEANSYLEQAANEGDVFSHHAVKSLKKRDIVDNKDRAERLKELRMQSSRLASKKYNINLRKMSKEGLSKEMEKAIQSGNRELSVLIKNEIGFRGLVSKDNIYSSHFTHNLGSKMIRSNFLNNIDAYRGYQDLKRTAFAMNVIIRNSAKYYGVVAKVAYNPVSHIHEHAVKIIGTKTGKDTDYINERVQKIKGTRRKVNDALGGKPLNELKAKHGSAARGVVTESSKAAKKGVKIVGNKWANSTRTGSAVKKAYQKVMPKAKKALNPFKKAKNSISTAFKKFGGKVNVVSVAIKKVITKIALAGVVAGGGVVVFGIIIQLLITSSTLILDAVDKELTESSMGIAYTKLKEKEEKFSQALGSLYMTEKPVGVVGEYEGAGGNTYTREIPKYTKSNINYYDGNGDTLTNGQTIKGILAMAAVYIDQDFAKYGNMVAFDSGFGNQENPDMTSLLGSTYKDYVAALYDATHMIGIEEDNQDSVYYCEDRLEAPYTCNNVITDVDHGTAKDSPPDGCDEEHCTQKEHFKRVNSGTDENGRPVYDTELDYVEYTCKANHRRCGGHIDLNADVVISNIYYPESEESELSEDDLEIADGGDQEEADNNEEPENIVEPLYSMYALDKYATAFHKYNGSEELIAEADENMSRDTTNAEGTSEPHTEILDIMNNIIKNVEGKENVNIARYVYWPENDPVIWDRHPTYYLIKDDGNINDNEPVTSENATPYRFVSYTSELAFNKDFAEHGWNKEYREQVQALLIPDWQELYGMSDFGYLTGTPLSKAQIEALIASNPEWENISAARKLLMALSLTLPEGHPYYASGMPSGRYAAASQPALSCAGYVKWLYWSAFNMENFPIGTIGINSQLQSDPKWEHYVGIENFDKLEPGDIVCKRDGGSNQATNQWNHVLIYAGKGPNGQRLWFHESGTAHGYKQLSTYSFAGYENTVQIYKLKNIDQMQIDYGENLGGTVDATLVGEVLSIGGNDIWIGWEHNESGGKGVTSIGDGGRGFGIFQFDSRYNSLYNYMKRCMDEYPGEYDEFEPWYNNRKKYLSIDSGGRGQLIESSFHDVWIRLNSIDLERSKELQYTQFYIDYMEPVYKYASQLGVDLNDYSPVMSGTLWSISIYGGPATVKNGYKKSNGSTVGIGALRIIKNGEAAGKSEDEILKEIYMEAAKYKSGIRDRWENVQLNEALSVYYAEYA